MKSKRKSDTDKRYNDLKYPGYNQIGDEQLLDMQIMEQDRSFWRSFSYGLRSMLAIIICLVIPVIWYFDWKPADAVRHTSEAVNNFFKDAPSIAPPSDIEPLAPMGADVIGYVTQLKEAGLKDNFSMPEIRAFYENHIPTDFLLNLRDADLLEGLSFPAIVAFYQNSVPIAYLSDLKRAQLLQKLSFPAVVSFYQNNVSLDYLKDLQQADLLDVFSFPGIVSFHQNQVPISFLQQLKAKGLLNKLSFPDIVNMYQATPS